MLFNLRCRKSPISQPAAKTLHNYLTSRGDDLFTLHVLVLVGLALLAGAMFRIRGEHENREGFTGLQMRVTAMFWHSVTAAGIFVFAVLYISPRLF